MTKGQDSVKEMPFYSSLPSPSSFSFCLSLPPLHVSRFLHFIMHSSSSSYSLSGVRLFATLWTVAHQVPSVHGVLQARILEWAIVPSLIKRL